MATVKVVLGLVFVSSIGLVPATAQPSRIIQSRTYFPTEWKWTEEKWTGNDKPYVAIRQRIDKAIANKQNLEALTRQYAKRAAANPSDPQAQFAWGYAAVLARKPGTHIGYQIPMAVSEALSIAPSPKSYQYARMRYIVLLVWGSWLQLKDLGKRLVERNEDDIQVKRRLSSLLAMGTPSERQRGLLYANQVVKRYPDRSFSYGTLGDVYYEILKAERNIDAGHKAIAAYRRALTLNPNPRAKDDLEHLIKTANKRIVFYRKQ